MKALLAVTGVLAGSLVGLGVLAILLNASDAGGACSAGSVEATMPQGGTGSWVATAYGPPWGGTQGNGVTASGLNLTAAPHVYEVAVDPSVIPLGSYVHVEPNPFGTSEPFYAGDTGGAIRGRHVDIYDWLGRGSQEAWGERAVSVTPAPALAPRGPFGIGRSELADEPRGAGSCSPASGVEAQGLTAGSRARILPDGEAVAPADAPTAVKRAIAAGNLIHTLPYPEPDVHYGTLAKLWPAYDCSGATSFVLYAAGLMGPNALDSTGLASYGEPGPGRWITVYANVTHAWIVVAGIALDTAGYGGLASPPGTGPRWRAQPLANLVDGTIYVARHWPGT
jgi:3D (Asp-Asp-Asp) domain-containing protein